MPDPARNVNCVGGFGVYEIVPEDSVVERSQLTILYNT